MIDPSLLKFLPDEAQAELRNWENLFAGKGWKQLQVSLEQNFESAKAAALSAKTWEDNRVATGYMDAIKFVFNLPDIIEQQYTGLAEQGVEAANDEAEDEALEYE
jgi:hypothetical protein